MKFLKTKCNPTNKNTVALWSRPDGRNTVKEISTSDTDRVKYKDERSITTVIQTDMCGWNTERYGYIEMFRYSSVWNHLDSNQLFNSSHGTDFLLIVVKRLRLIYFFLKVYKTCSLKSTSRL